MEFLVFLSFISIIASAVFGSVKIINQGDQALVETLGKYNGKTLEPGLNFVTPFLDRISYKETVREQVLDIKPQKCITRDNVSITVDAVVYWRIMDLAKAYYKVKNLKLAMENLILTQIRSEIGQLELDETFTARSQINEILLKELDIATDPWGVKITRVELRDILPSKEVQESMELQMTAERKKRAAILNSEGEKEAAINSAKGKAEAQVLDAEARKKSTVLAAEAERQGQVLKAQAMAEAVQILAKILKTDPAAREALQFLLAQNYLTMGQAIGTSNSSKVLFMDPQNIPATIEGVRAIINENKKEG